MHHAGIVHDVAHSNQSPWDLCDFCPQDQQARRILSVSCSNFDLQRVDDRMKIKRTFNMVNMMEESAMNHYIVLQWRINKIASWRSLKNSQINNCSWIICTILISSFWSSSCCQPCFPSIVRPMNRLWELILKIFFHSPEMNRSILFSMYLLRMSITFFDTSYSEREYFPGSISIQFLLSMGTILGEEPAGSLLCGFAVAFVRHAKIFALSFNTYSSSWSSGISVSLFKFITNLFDPWEILTLEWVCVSWRMIAFDGVW